MNHFKIFLIQKWTNSYKARWSTLNHTYLIDNYYDTEVLEKGHVGIIRCYSLMDEYNKAEDYYINHLSEIFSNDLKETAQNYIKKSNSSN